MHLEGFVSKLLRSYVRGPQLQERELVLIEPRKAFDLDAETEVGAAQGVQWWDPQMSLVCKVVNTTKIACVVEKGTVVAKVVAVNVRDRERLRNSYVADSGTTLQSRLENKGTVSRTSQPHPAPAEEKVQEVVGPVGVDLTEANMGQLGPAQKTQLLNLLSEFNEAGRFAVDPKRVKAAH